LQDLNLQQMKTILSLQLASSEPTITETWDFWTCIEKVNRIKFATCKFWTY
jgi:hypothetical protein